MAKHEPDLAPASITRQHVESYLAEVASTRSASTAQTRYSPLRLFFAWAAEEGEVPGNPMARVEPLIVPEQPVPVLTTTSCGPCWPPAHRRGSRTGATPPSPGAPRHRHAAGRAGWFALADVDVVGHVAVVLGKGRREGACPFGD